MKLGINSDAAAGLAVWGRWVDEERIAKTAEQYQPLEAEYWLGGTWAGNVSARKCLYLSSGQTAGEILLVWLGGL